jgi:hypothetical protein
MLDEATDDFGWPLMILPKHQGGLAELRRHVRHCDQSRESKMLCQMMDAQSLEENGV